MAAGFHKDAVKLVLPTHAPQQGSAALFYAAVLRELQHIQDTLSKASNKSTRIETETQHQAGDCSGDKAKRSLSTDAKEALATAIQLNAELHCLWRLDEAILRTSNVTELLDALPVLAPGPQVSGPASAAVRLKQLRAVFVSRSQQVNMAHSSYRCVSKHNDLYKTYVRTSEDLQHTTSADVSTINSFIAASGHSLSTETPAANDANCSLDSLGDQTDLQPFGSFITGVIADKSQQLLAAARPQQHATRRRSNQDNHCKSHNQRCSGGYSIDHCCRKRSSGSTASKSDTGSLCSANSDSVHSIALYASSPPEPCTLRSESFAEKIVLAIPKRVRSGFFGLAGLFGRGRGGQPPPKASHQYGKQQVAEAESPLRRSFSEPALGRRRCGVDFGAEAAAAATRSSYCRMQDNSVQMGLLRKSREGTRPSEDTRSALRSRSEPPTGRNRGSVRDRARRAGFAMASVEDLEYDDHFITADLTSRSKIFNSER